MIKILSLIIVIILIIYKFVKWMTMYYGYFKEKGVAHLKPVFLLGNTFGLFTKQYAQSEFVQKLYTSFPGEKIFGLFDFRKPFFVLRNPDVIKQLAIKDFEYFLDHQLLLEDNSDRLFSNSLLFLRGDKWRQMRTTLSPAFTGSKIRQMFELVTECAEDMSTYFLKKSTDGKRISLEMKETFSRYTTDAIATCAFGIKINSFENQNNEFSGIRKHLNNFASLRMMIKLVFLRMTPLLMKILNIEFVDSYVQKFFQSMILNNMKIREKEGIFRPDMINIMMKLKNGQSICENKDTNNKLEDGFAIAANEESMSETVVDNKKSWSDDEIVAQCFIFYAAGFDTSSTLLSFAAFELATNLDIQERLYEEICDTNEQLKGKRISYDALQKMQYMDMIISETLRKNPSISFTDRVCVKDYQYDDGERQFKIEKGTLIWIPVYGIQHDPEYFPNPECFDPERFNKENRRNINLGTYLPFGIGPRTCIGSRFALMQVKAILYYILLNFQLIPNEKTDIPVKFQNSPVAVVFKNGMNLDMKLRNK